MKVLNIVSAWPRWGGDTITLWLVHQVNELNHAGNRVDVFAPSWKSRRSGVMFNPLWEYWPYSIHRFRYFPARWETLTHEKPASDGASSLWGKAKAACYGAGCWRGRPLLSTRQLQMPGIVRNGPIKPATPADSPVPA